MYHFVSSDPRGGHNRKSINSNFFKTWSSSMAYVLGFIYADGAIEEVQRSSRTCYISITSKDFSILNAIKQAMASQHQLYKRPVRKITFPNGKSYLSSEQFILRIGNKSMYNDLLGHGLIPRKSLIISFPSIPLDYISHFIRGYFDGDGCIYLIERYYPRIVFTSGSLDFLNGLAKILTEILQIPLKVVYFSHKNSINPCYQLQYNSKISSKILEFMYKDLNMSPYLERKYEIYQNFLKLKVEVKI